MISWMYYMKILDQTVYQSADAYGNAADKDLDQNRRLTPLFPCLASGVCQPIGTKTDVNSGCVPDYVAPVL